MVHTCHILFRTVTVSLADCIYLIGENDLSNCEPTIKVWFKIVNSFVVLQIVINCTMAQHAVLHKYSVNGRLADTTNSQTKIIWLTNDMRAYAPASIHISVISGYSVAHDVVQHTIWFRSSKY
jgi:hypothetical protein